MNELQKLIEDEIGSLDARDIEPLTDEEELMLWSAVETFGGACIHYDRVARRRKLSATALAEASKMRITAYEGIVEEVRRIARRCIQRQEGT